VKRGLSKTVRSVRKRGETKKEKEEKETNRQTETGQQSLLTKRCFLAKFVRHNNESSDSNKEEHTYMIGFDI
jgi:hypothetical protein